MGLRSRNKGKRGEREAAAEVRRIFGTDDANQIVSWPEGGPTTGMPRILLFYISRSGTALERDKYQGNSRLITYRCLVFSITLPRRSVC
ncbi:MAG: hypothetical protein QGG71_23680 [Pirellulaceae bacterium]|jgi:hypothetical protein|nr:hypothetical protein [Pirellulaceae bacterium]